MPEQLAKPGLLDGRLTMRPKMTISHEELTKYIFQPMLARPIGMMKTNTILPKLLVQVHSLGSR